VSKSLAVQQVLLGLSRTVTPTTDTSAATPALVLDGDALDPIGGEALVGYARVSTTGQLLDSIVAGLRQRGIGFRSCTKRSTPPPPAGGGSSTSSPRSRSSSAS
jgi:hypothetical protein